MPSTATFQRHLVSRSHKAAAHCATWHSVTQSFCSCIRWPDCSACWAAHSQIQHCCCEESYRWGGKFPILKCATIAWSQRCTITSELMEFHMEYISGGASRFVFEDQPPDAFEFQFGKIVQFNFFLSSWLYSPFPSIINNSSSHLSLEYFLDWCRSPNFISCQGRIRVPKSHFNTPHPPLVLPSRCFFPFFVLLPECFSSYESPIGQKRHMARKTEEFHFIWGQTVNVSAIPLIFLRSRGCHSLSEPLEARERLRKVNEMLASPDFVLTFGALSTSCNKVTGSSSLQKKQPCCRRLVTKIHSTFILCALRAAKPFPTNLEPPAKEQKTEARTRKCHRKRAKESKNITQVLITVEIKCDSSNSMTLESKLSCPRETVRIKKLR